MNHLLDIIVPSRFAYTLDLYVCLLFILQLTNLQDVSTGYTRNGVGVLFYLYTRKECKLYYL